MRERKREREFVLMACILRKIKILCLTLYTLLNFKSLINRYIMDSLFRISFKVQLAPMTSFRKIFHKVFMRLVLNQSNTWVYFKTLETPNKTVSSFLSIPAVCFRHVSMSLISTCKIDACKPLTFF